MQSSGRPLDRDGQYAESLELYFVSFKVQIPALQAAKTLASNSDNTLLMTKEFEEGSSCVIIWGYCPGTGRKGLSKTRKAPEQTVSRSRFEPSAFPTQGKVNAYSTTMFAK
jgi:hypothetical protein